MSLQPPDHVFAVLLELQITARRHQRGFQEFKQRGEVAVVAVVWRGGKQQQSASILCREPACEAVTIG
jgi:hypothetical protein